MKISDYFLDKFYKESENIVWGEIIIKATFQDGKPVFFLEKHTSEKYISDSMSAMEVKTG